MSLNLQKFILIPQERYNHMCEMLKKQTNVNDETNAVNSNSQLQIKELNASDNEGDNDVALENIIQHFPERMRTRARLIGSFLKKDKNYLWNNKGELIYNNEPVSGSSVTD